ncbi:YjbQ family protein [Methanosarcina sp.]|uniref:YjbQ family protein n=1 Tax=Methanosarcina sp. TaxID=2213 RepID=UPI003C789877
MVDLTEMVLEGLTESKIANGTVAIFCNESTGAIRPIGFEPKLSKDASETLVKLIPRDEYYHHQKIWVICKI